MDYLMVWHYSAWSKLSDIVASDMLKGSNTNAENELPMVWFSANQKWEPTASKMVADNAYGIRLRTLTFEEQVELLGCIRFGLASNDKRLLNWKTACTFAGTPNENRKALEKVGRSQGGDPMHWYATASAIPLSELHFQVWQDERWQNATSLKDMVDVWELSRVVPRSDLNLS